MFWKEFVHQGKNEPVSWGCIKKLLVETVAYVIKIPFLDSHSPYILKSGLTLLNDKALEIPNYGKTEAQIWPLG